MKNLIQKLQQVANVQSLKKGAKDQFRISKKKKKKEKKISTEEHFSKETNHDNITFHSKKVCPELDVKLIKDKNQKNNYKVHPLLPQPPFFVTCVAPRNSGKSNNVCDLFTDSKKMGKTFDMIGVFSATYYQDTKLQKIKPDFIYEKFDPNIIEEIFTYAEEETAEYTTNGGKKPPKILLIFDDMIDQNIMKVQKIDILERIAVRGRHVGISVLIISQLYKKISNPIRVNSTNMIFYRVQNQGELKKIIDENQEMLSVKNFRKIFDFCTSEPYCFLHIDKQEKDPYNRFRKNWNHPISIDKPADTF